jgi:plastocyanin
VRKSLALIAALAVSAAVAVPALAATKKISVGDFFFVRNSSSTPSVTVHRGTVVKWVWRGQIAHNVTVTRGPAKFHSRTITHGSYSHRMKRRGTYRIICTIHPNMKLVLHVR